MLKNVYFYIYKKRKNFSHGLVLPTLQKVVQE
jgi:hypothetical protein